MSGNNFFRKVGWTGVSIAMLGAVGNLSLYNVDGGQRAVVFDRLTGVRQKEVGEGTHFVIPILQKPYIYDIRSQPRSVSTLTGSKDLQNINITVRVLYRPIASSLSQIFTNLGVDYDERVLPSIVNEVIKSVVGRPNHLFDEEMGLKAQFNAVELITQREMVSHNIADDLRHRAAHFGIILDDISITHLTFGKEFTEAVEMKQIAQQEAERWRFIVEKEEEIKKAVITRAEGDASAAQILGQAFKESGEGLVELRKIEAAQEVAKEISQSGNVTYLPGQQQSLLLTLPQ